LHLTEIQKAIAELEKNEYSCVVLKDDKLYRFNGIGVKPIISNLDINKTFFEDALIADKIIGKAAALLLVMSKIKMVYGAVMSQTAIEVFENNKTSYQYGEKVPFISNRTSTGMCPLEQSVADIDQPEKAYIAIKNKIADLMKQS